MTRRPSRIKETLFFLALFVNCTGASYASKHDVEYWQSINWTNWKIDPCKLYTIAEIRFNKYISKFYHLKISECFAYQALPCLAYEIHACYVNNKAFSATQFVKRYQMELEANPSLAVGNAQITMRNRLVLAKQENIPHIRLTLRHRLLASFPLENYGMVSAIQCYDEIFYDFDHHKLSQNRLVPISLTFTLNKKIAADLFFMIRNFFSFSTDQWITSFVVGSQINF